MYGIPIQFAALHESNYGRHISDIEAQPKNVRFEGGSVESVFLNGKRKSLGPPMGFVGGDVGATPFHPKSAMDLRSGATERCSGREGEKLTFAKFSVSSDFQLLRQYQGEAK